VCVRRDLASVPCSFPCVSNTPENINYIIVPPYVIFPLLHIKAGHYIIILPVMLCRVCYGKRTPPVVLMSGQSLVQTVIHSISAAAATSGGFNINISIQLPNNHVIN